MQEFRSVVERHAAMVQRIVSAYERRPDIAEEIVQDTFLAVWRSLPRLRRATSERAFIARIARNLSISHVRRALKMPQTSLDERVPDTADVPEEAMALAQTRARLAQAVHDLPDTLRGPIVLFLEGFGQTEIAEVLGLSLTNAGVRLSRAREALSLAMKEPSDDGR